MFGLRRHVVPGPPKLQSYLIAKAKFAVTSPSFTSTSWVWVPSLRCAASTVYLPGGTFLMTNLPSEPLTQKQGLSNTLTHANIHGCTSHLKRRNISGWAYTKFKSAPPGICTWLDSGLPGTAGVA